MQARVLDGLRLEEVVLQRRVAARRPTRPCNELEHEEAGGHDRGSEQVERPEEAGSDAERADHDRPDQGSRLFLLDLEIGEDGPPRARPRHRAEQRRGEDSGRGRHAEAPPAIEPAAERVRRLARRVEDEEQAPRAEQHDRYRRRQSAASRFSPASRSASVRGRSCDAKATSHANQARSANFPMVAVHAGMTKHRRCGGAPSNAQRC
jgi:hypothetical protein